MNKRMVLAGLLVAPLLLAAGGGAGGSSSGNQASCNTKNPRTARSLRRSIEAGRL